MSIRYESLDEPVRAFIRKEVERDRADGTLYISPRLTEAGAAAWLELLLEACARHDDAWLASQLRSRGLMRTEEQRRKPKGGFTTSKVPVTAPDTLAEGEFNRFYARGLCAEVLNSGGIEVEVYRGKTVETPRPESQAMIGRRLPAARLLEDLRSSPGVEPAMGLPRGPNSGLTVRRVRNPQ